MPTYVALLNWTDQGIRNFKDTVDRAEAAREMAEKLGGGFTNIYWTIGPYDIVGIIEAPDDETVEAQLLALGSQGNVRTTTMRAFTADEMRPIVERATG
jgi:uncharacterized protein with GYD domain